MSTEQNKILTRAAIMTMTNQNERRVAGKKSTNENFGKTSTFLLKGRARRHLNLTIGVCVLALIALVAALYLARAFFVPLLVGILASYSLSPVVSWLNKCYVPRALGAALVLIALLGSLGWIGASLSKDTSAMINKFPDAARKLRQSLNDSRDTSGPSSLQNMQEAAIELQGAATDAGAKPGTQVLVARTIDNTSWLKDFAVTQTSLVFTVVSQAPIVLLLTYFLLASGTHFRRKLLQFVGPSLARKKDTGLILDEIDIQVQRYLLSMLASNVLVGIGTWLAFAALGIDHAEVWGVAAAVLHFIPYLGPAIAAIGGGVAAFLQFESLLHALSTAGITLLVAGAVGFIFLPWLQSRFAGVNAAVLFISLLFFGWLWGVWGLLLGAPLVAIAKVICDRVGSLKPIGELLGR